MQARFRRLSFRVILMRQPFIFPQFAQHLIFLYYLCPQ